MGRVGRAMWAVGLVAAVAAAKPALARDDDPEREARRHELRQQLRAERERWLAEGRRPGGPWVPPGGAPGGFPGRVHGGFPGAVPGGFPGAGPGAGPAAVPAARSADPTYVPGPGPGPGYGYGAGPGGYGGGHRLSPDERRELRQTLRQHRP